MASPFGEAGRSTPGTVPRVGGTEIAPGRMGCCSLLYRARESHDTGMHARAGAASKRSLFVDSVGSTSSRRRAGRALCGLAGQDAPTRRTPSRPAAEGARPAGPSFDLKASRLRDVSGACARGARHQSGMDRARLDGHEILSRGLHISNYDMTVLTSSHPGSFRISRGRCCAFCPAPALVRRSCGDSRAGQPLQR